jgi:hypothetical protein
MSRIARENEKYLARVKASIDREKNYRAERQREREELQMDRQRERDEARELRNADRQLEREERNQRNLKIAQSNERYSDLWIATTGLSVPQIINLSLRGGDAGMLLNKLDLRIYNRSTKSVEDVSLITLMNMIKNKGFPDLRVSYRGQVTLDDMVIPAKVYFFIRYHWLMSSGQVESQRIFASDTTSPAAVPIATASED